MPRPDTIDAVIEDLDQIVQDAIRQASPLGYFAALYKRVTIHVRDAIAAGRFDDNPRMEKLDIHFANRYLDAYHHFQNQQPTTASWQLAFEQAAQPKPIVLQHLLLGMSAHINLDLGIAAAETAATDPLSAKADFLRINQILGDLIDDTQARLTRMFRPLGLIDRLLGPVDETLSLFSINYARDKAWTQALELCLATSQSEPQLIHQRDQSVASFSQTLVQPKKLRLRLLLLAIRLLEKGDIPSRIKALDTDAP